MKTMNIKTVITIALFAVTNISLKAQFYEVLNIKSQTLKSEKNEWVVIYKVQEVVDIEIKQIRKSREFPNHVEIQCKKLPKPTNIVFLKLKHHYIRSLSFDYQKNIIYINVPEKVKVGMVIMELERIFKRPTKKDRVYKKE